MSDFRPLSAGFSVAPQISIEDVAEAKAQGFAMIVNNRPDGEEPSAPQGGDIAHAAAAEGLAYAAIPIGHSGFSHAQIDALEAGTPLATGRISREGYQYTWPSRSGVVMRTSRPRPAGPATQWPPSGS